ncbi:hypothetical protein [Glycomyces terrestris]|uniref:DUF1579 domain-containing protein n=1 Tax=Glycomyces terrestris TaxID=2493553 RepID=A0A426UW24_9ACTN|nr:hypothetical protein [Glycomyces terrestris]RRR98546.1 hypothetical protein EIW28_16860 [Glycomyces terrestris]
MRNEQLRLLEGLLGSWRLTLSDAWFLEPPGTEVHGSATVEWLGDAFLVMRCDLDGDLTMVFGRSDANDAFTALYQDDRGVCRVFAVTVDGSHVEFIRKDPDFHQRFIAEIGPDRILGRWEASEDRGATWRKDFDLTYDRVAEG